MNVENIKALVRFRLEQSKEALQAARILESGHLPREVINRAYYAMFYAVLALLAVRKKETSKHQGVIALFDVEFVRPGTFDKDFSEWLHAAFNLRLKSDYSPMFQVSAEDAQAILAKAERFVSGVKTQLAAFLSTSDATSEE